MADGSIQQGALDDLAQWLRASLDRTYCRVLVVDDRGEHVHVAAAAAAMRRTPLEWNPYATSRTMLAELPGRFLDREPVLLEGTAIPRTAPFLQAIGKDPLTELLIVPLVFDGRVVGLLDLGECRARAQRGGRLEHGQPRRPSRPGLDGKDSLLDSARRMAPLAARVLESERKRQLLERLEGTLRELQSETGALWRAISHLGAELLSAACGAVYVCHANTEEFVLLASNNRGNLAESLVARCRRGEGFVGSLGATAARRWPDAGGCQSPFIDGAALRSAVAVAIPGADIETVLVVADDASRRIFTDTEIDVLERFVLHASLAHRRAHLSPESRQLAQFKVLHQITDYTRKLQDLDRGLHALLTGVTAGYGLRFNRAALFLYNEARATLDGKMAIGNVTWEDALADWQHDRQAGPYDFAEYVEIVGGNPLPVTRLHELVTGLSLPLDDGGVLRDALDSPRLLLSNHDASRLPDAIRKVFAPDAKAPILLVRLMTTHPLGLIIADNQFNGAPIGLEAIEALTTFAGAAAIAIERFQLRDESELVDRAARALVEPPDTYDPVAVMRRIVGEAVTLCNASAGVLWPYYEDGQQFAPQFIAVNLSGGSERDMLACRPRTSGMARRVLEKHYVAVPSVAVEPVLGSERRQLLVAAGIQSFQGIALQVGNERLGVLYVDYPAPRRFEDVDRRRLTRFAVHAALALKSARLARRVHDAQRTERALARIAPLTYLDKTIDHIAELAKDLLECAVVVLHVYDASTDTFIGHHHVGDLVDAEAAARDVQEDSSLVRRVMEQPGPLAVEELEQDRWFGPTRFARVERIQSCLALPLKVSNPDLVVGALFANFRDRRRFTADLRMRARSFASQAGIAIGNALKLRENEALAAVPRALLTTENLQDTLDCVARMTAAALGVRGTSPVMSQVVLKEGLDLVIRAVAGGDERMIGTSLAPGIGSQAGFAADMKEPVVAIYDDAELRFNVSDEIRRGFKSGMSARMVVGKELIGILEIRSPYVREFGESHTALLLSVAAQAAMAIKADRRNTDLERKRGHLQALRRAEECAERVRVRRGGMTREDVLNELLQIVVECYREHSVAPRPTTFGTLLLRKPSDILVLEGVYPPDRRQRFEAAIGPGWRLNRRPVGITGWTVIHGEPRLEVNLSSAHPTFVAIDDATRSEITAPILSCGAVVGVLDVESDSPRGFDRDDLNTLVTLAGFVAIALTNHGTDDIRRAAHDLGKSMTLSRDATRDLLGAGRDPDPATVVQRLEQQLEDFDFHCRLTDDIKAAAMVLNEEPLHKQWTSLVELIEAAIDRFRATAANKQIRLDRRVPPADPIPLWIDKDRIRQVITNLLANAIQYTQTSGAVEVSIVREPEADRVIVAVADNGRHRPPVEDLTRMFAPYYRVRSTGAGAPAEREDDVGQGLGLSIAKTLVELHRGRIWAEHNDRGGLTVAFDLASKEEASPGNGLDPCHAEDGAPR